MRSLNWICACARFLKNRFTIAEGPGASLCSEPGVGGVRRLPMRRGRQAMLAAVASIPFWVGAGAKADAVVWRKNFFPIGVWSQPIDSFDTWKSRGINTLVKYESDGGQDSLNAWTSAANAKGFYQIREPRRKVAADLHEPLLLAWMHNGTPDNRKIPAATWASRYAKLKAADRGKPVLANFSGGNVLNAKSPDAYRRYLASADWISNDFYPVTGWGRPDWIDYRKKVSDRKTPGMVVSRLSEWSGRKPQFAMVETSNQRLSWNRNSRGVTPGELRAEVWDAIINGAKGIVYSPMQIGRGFRYDATPADVVNEMIAQNARIKSLAAVINAREGTVPWIESSPMLEGMTRSRKGIEYFFVLNMSSKPLEDQQIVLKGLKVIKDISVVGESRSLHRTKGYIVDDFGPYEMHVYQADIKRPRLGPVVIPEPVGLMPVLMGVALLRRRR